MVASLPRGRNIILCSASGAGYYGSRGDDLLKENEMAGDDFLAGVSVDWEKEALQAADEHLRVVVMRFGVILGKDGGALAKMIPAFKFFVGGSMGSGQQWFPWMHLADLMAAVQFIFENDQINGPVNFCAPNPIRYRDLAKTLGEALKRPAVMPAASDTSAAHIFLSQIAEKRNFEQDSLLPGDPQRQGVSVTWPLITSHYLVEASARQ